MSASASLDDRIDRFRDRVLGRPLGEDTFEDYQRWIRRFERWCDREGRDDPGLPDLLDFDQYLHDEERSSYPWGGGRGRDPPRVYAYSTRTNAISACKLWVERMYDTPISEVPKEICYGEPEEFDPTYLSFDTIETVIADADECQYEGCQAALALSYDAILRASELVRVRPEDVSLDGKSLYVRATKGSLNTTVGLERDTVDRVQAFLDRVGSNRDRLFRDTNGEQLTKRQWANHVLKTHCEAGSHTFARHSPIVHRLESPERFETMDEQRDTFSQVFRRSRHRHPSMLVRYARIVDINAPEWAGEPDA